MAEAVVSLLLENGADPTNTDNKGRIPLQIAQENDKHDCVAAKLRNFLNVNRETSRISRE